MLNYDFSTLNDKEFESFGIQIVSIKTGVFIERFKAGKDKGVDGRFFKFKNEEVIVQCKHWVKSSFEDLFKYLKNTELEKVKKLNPTAYILVVSHELSRENKKKIFKLFDPYIKSESDI